MIIETFLSLALIHSQPQLPLASVMNWISPPAYAARFGATSSSFRSSSSSFRPSSSSFRSTSTSFKSSTSFSRPSTSVRSTPSPKPSTSSSVKPFTSSSSSNNIVRINKQISTSKPLTAPKIESLGSTSRPSVVTLPKPSSAPKIESSKNTRTSSPAPVVTRERYIERYTDSGIGGNPWFWMYMLDNNRPQQQIQQPAQIIVKDSDNKTVTVPENQMVIRKYSYSPVREFFVFALGGGIGVLFGRKFSL